MAKILTTESEIRAYIERTGMEYVTIYDLAMKEMDVLHDIATTRELWDAVSLAYNFGKAKGYRLAKNRGTGN